MTVDVERLAKRIGTQPSDDVQATLDSANAFYAAATEGAFRPIPEGVADEAILSIGYALWDRRKSSHGAQQVPVMEGQMLVRSPRDPLASVRTILADYVVPVA